MSIKVTKTPITTARTCTSKATMEHIRKLLRAPANARIEIVTADGCVVIDDDAQIAAEWTETRPARVRVKKEG